MQEVKAQCLLFLLAGYETTSTALSYLTYELSVNQDIQKRLQNEVDEYFRDQVITGTTIHTHARSKSL